MCPVTHAKKTHTLQSRKTKIKITTCAAEMIKVGKQMQKKGNL